MAGDGRAQASARRSASVNIRAVGGLGHHLGQVGAHRGQGQQIAVSVVPMP
jgi:hypothetical protein